MAASGRVNESKEAMHSQSAQVKSAGMLRKTRVRFAQALLGQFRRDRWETMQ